MIDILSISSEIALGIPQDFADDKAILVQVMPLGNNL